jgi:hypothetical protein
MLCDHHLLFTSCDALAIYLLKAKAFFLGLACPQPEPRLEKFGNTAYCFTKFLG